MSNRTNEVPYYRTIPSREASHEPDDDTIYLLGEGEMIEMSPEISTTDDNIEPNPKLDEQIAAADQPKEEEEDEEAILRRRLMEKKREKEVAKVDKEPKQPSRKEQQSLQPEKERREQQRYYGSSSSSDHPKRERIVWKDSERKPTSYSSSHHQSDPSGRQERRERTDQPSRKIDVREKFTTSAPSSSHHAQRMDERRDKQHSSTSISHHRKEKRDEDKRKEEEQARRDEKVKKRPRMVSDSSGEEPKKAPKREEKEQHMHAHHRQPQQKNMENPVDDVEEKEGTSPVQSVTPLEMEMAMDLVINEQPQYAKKPKKYSKFESSPEQSEDDQNEDEPIYSGDELKTDLAMNEEKTLKEEEMADEDEEMDGLVDSDLPENKEFDKLTDQDKALLTPEKLTHMEAKYQRQLISSLPVYYPGISGCRSVVEYECLNKISEGTFGVVYRAQERRTDEIVALKRLKMEKEHQGFPITSLREINMLLKCGTHKNVLNVREVVVGSSMDKIYMVMEYVEHDLKSLMELMKSRNKKWTISQVKTLLHQLLSGIEHMHNEYVIHRDLKTSNLLLSHGGILKIGDFGLAREFGEPIKPYTPVVVTLWYRSPELLLGTKLYSTPVDMWSVGCIFGEFLKLDPMFPGRNEIDQLQKIFKEVGTPNEDIWPGCMQLPGMKTGVFADTPYNQLRRKFASELPDDDGYELFNKLLALDPKKRLSAKQALSNRWFLNDPKPTPPSSFPTWPAKSEHNKKPPNEPVAPRTKPVGGFTLKFDVPKF